MRQHTMAGAALVLTLALAPLLAQAPEPETVMITLRVKPGAEEALTRVLARHWDAVTRLDLVRADATHLTLRTVESTGGASFVEILTWRDAAIPDHAPAEILAIWKEMNGLVESRGGTPGLVITPMTTIAASAR